MGGIRLLVLGPLIVERDGQSISVGGSRQRRLLVALSVGRTVRTAEQLIDAVWAEEKAPADPRAALRTSMTRLRHAVGSDSVVTYPNGWGLDDEIYIDAEHFDELFSSSMKPEMSSARRLVMLDEAHDLWRGPAFGDFAGEGWVRGQQVRLEEMRVGAIESRFRAMLEAGMHAEAIPGLAAAVEAHPHRDNLVGAHMLALYRSGQQVAATQVFQAHRQRLQAEVGLDPGLELVELDRRIITDDPGLKVVEGGPAAERSYELLEEIGGGAHSIVYRGVQAGLGREVALKVIRPSLADQPDFIERFEVEAQLVAKLEHPHVVPLYDYWREQGKACLVFRYMRGGSLEHLLETRGPLSLSDCTRLVEQVGGALSAAHQVGVLHRDVRPANILLDEANNFYLADFGIALARAADSQSVGSLDAGPDVRALIELVRLALGGEMPPALGSFFDQIEGFGAIPTSVQTFVERFRRSTVDNGERITKGAAGAPLNVTNPFVGLAAFCESDARLFFGRTALVHELVGKLARPRPQGRLLVLVGPSGIGKSSVVHAGLIPALRSGAVESSVDWLYASMTPGGRPFDELSIALLKVAERAPDNFAAHLREDEFGLARAVRALLPEDRELLLVVDQFEELFTGQHGVGETDRFLRALVRALQDKRCPLRLVVSVRADFWDRPLQSGLFTSLLKDAVVNVGALSARELEEAITLPVRAAGADYEPGLVSELLADVANQPGALPLLQYTLRSLWDTQISGLLTIDSYREMGGVASALASGADKMLAASCEAEQAVLRSMMRRLVIIGQHGEVTRRRALRSELGEDAVTQLMVDRMAAERLLTLDSEPVDNRPTVEVAHEALLRDWPTLRRWLEEDRHELQLGDHLARSARSWIEAGRTEADLYRGGRLASIEEIVAAGRLQPSMLETEFIDQSIEVRLRDEASARVQLETERKTSRRLRRLASVVAVVAVVAVLAGGLAFQQRSRAEATAVAAETDRLVAQSAGLAETDSRLATLLALAAYDREQTPATLGALQTALVSAGPTLAVLGRGREYIDVELLSNGLIVGVRANGLDLFDPLTTELIDEHEMSFRPPNPFGDGWPHQVVTAKTMPRLVALDQGGAVQILDVNAQGFALKASWVADQPLISAAISPDGEHLLYADVDHTVRGFSADGEATFVFEQDEPATLLDKGLAQFDSVALPDLWGQFLPLLRGRRFEIRCECRPTHLDEDVVAGQ